MADKNGGEKFCPDCGAHRPVEDFTRDRRRRDGLAFYCRDHARRRLRASKERRQGPPKRRFALDRHVPDGHKWCPDCDAVKPLADFPKTSATKSGRHSYCRPCHNARGRASLDKIGGSRTYHLKRRYGITAEDADAMLAAQDGRCAICRAAPAAHIDHDHDTGRVRQLLCFGCNGGLGQFKDDPATLRAAARYVEGHRAGPTRADEPEAGERVLRAPRGSGDPGGLAVRGRAAGCSHRDVVRARVAAVIASLDRPPPH
ncbi:Recombination endonuclease VII [Geodermatophilus telluris]|uniref:Recombination endonuclease VII n=1 Tax=Geodermatophilus telluris TaxID=1190417 RepID=A0A1G6TDI2_9ACTN|nr:endonuclease VII domain-containing protein [Geodermatophilus telluris]SDD26497.1 Recombination endonuclease VII [Geodermatophilus telluris]